MQLLKTDYLSEKWMWYLERIHIPWLLLYKGIYQIDIW